jgi:hypothetical protein
MPALDLLARVANSNNKLVEGGDILKIFDKIISQGGGLIRAGGPGSLKTLWLESEESQADKPPFCGESIYEQAGKS